MTPYKDSTTKQRPTVAAREDARPPANARAASVMALEGERPREPFPFRHAAATGLLPMALALFVLSASFANAAETNAPDYSVGLRKFYALVAPDAVTSRYVTITVTGEAAYELSSRTEFTTRFGMRGNAWIIREDSNGTARALIPPFSLVTLCDPASPAATQDEARAASPQSVGIVMRRGRRDANTPTRMLATWKDADLAADSAKLLKRLAKSDEDERRRFEYSQPDAASALMLAACFLQHGLTNEAGILTTFLFEQKPSTRLLFESYNMLANTRCAETYSEFKVSQDWAAYSNQVADLLARFGVGWQLAPAVRRIQSNLCARIASPEPPALTNWTDDEAWVAREIALQPLPESIAYSGEAPWVLNQPSTNAMVKTNVFERIQACGPRYLNVLSALLTDDYLVSGALPFNNGMSFDSFESYSDEDRLAQAYQSMPRPLSRGDIARLLLRKTIPIRDEESYELERDPEEFAAYVREWITRHANDSESDLIMAFLEGGNRNQRQGVLSRACTSTNIAALASSIENTFANSEYPDNDFESVKLYVAARGAQADAFIDRYAQVLADRMAANSEDMDPDSARQQAKRTRRFIDSLRKTSKKPVATADAATMIAALATNAPMTIHKQWSAASAVFAKEPPPKVQRLLAEAALATTNPVTASILVSYAMQPDYREALLANADTWRKLLADPRPLSDNDDDTLGNRVAYTLEQSFDRNTYLLIQKLGQRRTTPWFLKRAEARLSGADVDTAAPTPTGNSVTGLEAKVLSATNLMSTLENLSLDELIYLQQSCGTNFAIHETLLPAANRITRSDSTNEASPLRALPAMTTIPATLPSLLATLCSNHTSSLIDISAWRDPALDGWRIYCSTNTRPATNAGAEVITLSLSVSKGIELAATWPPVLRMPEPARPEMTATLRSLEQELDAIADGKRAKLLEGFAAALTNAPCMSTIYLAVSRATLPTGPDGVVEEEPDEAEDAAGEEEGEAGDPEAIPNDEGEE